ncbi:MAG: hypothetical protein WB770_06880 [Acidimicrobiales bacterium]
MPLGSVVSRRMRRRDSRILAFAVMLAGLITFASTTAASASARPADSHLATTHQHSRAASSLVVKSAKRGKVGSILITSSGYTLYHFTLDTSKKIACNVGCTEAWPPLMLPKGVTHALAGSGVKQALLGTRKRGNGLQVTYKGLPLYRYAADTAPGQTNGQGVGGTWFVVKAAA